MSLPPLPANSPASLTADPALLLSLATEHLDRGDPTTACDLLRRLVQLQPESGQAWVALARAYYLQGDFETSFATYQRALSSKKEGNCEAQLWYGIGLLSARVKDYDNAITMLKMVFTVDSGFKESGEVWLALGQIYRERENWPEALKALKQSTTALRGPKLSKAFCTLGLCHEELEEGEMAVTAYRKAAESDSTAARPLAMLGWALRVNRESALAALNQALSLGQGKEEALAHYLLGRVLYLHRVSTAPQELKVALEMDPTNPVYLISMAVVHYEAKDWTACEAYLGQVVDFLQDQSLLWYDLGVLYEARNRKIDAKKAYERAVELDKGRFQAPKARLSAMDTKPVPEMLHPAFDIEENGLIMRVRPVDIRPVPKEVRTPVFKVTRADPVLPRPIPTGRKRTKLDPNKGNNVPANMGMYPMMPFLCMPPGADMAKATSNGFPGYFPMYYPYMMPCYMPAPEAPSFPAQQPTAKVPQLPSSPSSAASDSARPPVDLDDLISHSSDQASDSDEGGSIDGIHIGGKRRE